MGCSALLNIANILVLATAAHGVDSARLGLGKTRCRVTSVTTVLAACRQCRPCGYQMRRSPTLWLSEGTASNRTTAPAIGMPMLRLKQLQPGGCTRYPASPPGRECTPSSRCASTSELKASVATYLTPTFNHARRPRMTRTNIRTPGLVAYSKAGGRKRKTAQDGNILASASSLRIGTEAPLTMSSVLAHCPDIVGMAPAPLYADRRCVPDTSPDRREQSHGINQPTICIDAFRVVAFPAT